tara:strand:- start:91 stop:549 length:459 start_codon:yes stop_codon:yes gene_type:complete
MKNLVIFFLILFFFNNLYSQESISLKCKGVGKNDSKYLIVNLSSKEKDIKKLKETLKTKILHELFFVGVLKNKICKNGIKPISKQFNYDLESLNNYLSDIKKIESFVLYKPNYPIVKKKINRKENFFEFNVLVDLKNLRRELFIQKLIITKL